jgi:hypothetical protein
MRSGASSVERRKGLAGGTGPVCPSWLLDKTAILSRLCEIVARFHTFFPIVNEQISNSARQGRNMISVLQFIILSFNAGPPCA